MQDHEGQEAWYILVYISLVFGLKHIAAFVKPLKPNINSIIITIHIHCKIVKSMWHGSCILIFVILTVSKFDLESKSAVSFIVHEIYVDMKNEY